MEIYRPTTGEESVSRRQFLKKLALGTGAVGIAGITGLTILKAEKLQQQAWRSEILKREIECTMLGSMKEQNNILKKPKDWVPEEVEYYNKVKRNSLIAGTTTEISIAYFAFKDKIVNSDAGNGKQQPSHTPPQK